MSDRNRQKTGKKGEDLAAELLKKKGMEVVERNWRNRFGEIDIICMDGDVLVFVEVKAKVGENFGSPEEMIGERKLEQVRRTSLYFDTDIDRERRIDVVVVVFGLNGEIMRLEYYENVG